MEPLTIAEIVHQAIKHNLALLRKNASCRAVLCPAVKADAYGHGIKQILPILIEAGVERLAVAHLSEAIEIRQLGWPRPILSFAPMLAGCSDAQCRERAEAAVSNQVSLTVMSENEAQMLEAVSHRLNQPAGVEIKVDTGMGRMGLHPDEAERLVMAIAHSTKLTLQGVYTHFAGSDETDPVFAREQLRTFLALKARLVKQGVPVEQYHAANSAAIFRLPDSHLDRIRPGLALYGYWSGPAQERPVDLMPAMRVTSRLTAIRHLPAGHSVGYGQTFITRRKSTIGIVPVGYADGYRRLLSNEAVMTIDAVRGQPRRIVPVVGRISMDQTTVDLTDAGDVRPGDRIIIIDNDYSAPNSVENMAGKLATIPYEITCLIGNRVKRILV